MDFDMSPTLLIVSMSTHISPTMFTVIVYVTWETSKEAALLHHLCWTILMYTVLTVSMLTLTMLITVLILTICCRRAARGCGPTPPSAFSITTTLTAQAPRTWTSSLCGSRVETGDPRGVQGERSCKYHSKAPQECYVTSNKAPPHEFYRLKGLLEHEFPVTVPHINYMVIRVDCLA